MTDTEAISPIAPEFLLVGNNSYRNRGCEAIVRGTMEILRGEFGPEVRARSGVFERKEMIAKQNETEIDPAVCSFALSGLTGPRWSLEWWMTQVTRRLRGSFRPHLEALREPAKSACAALKVGGDLYTLDYGVPHCHLEMDRFLRSLGLPVVLWAGSVGPFEANPRFAPQMLEHLRRLDAIFVRETESLNYLRSRGVSDNVHLMADPGFLLRPVEPPASKVRLPLAEGTVGINLSPLLARFRSPASGDGDLEGWLRFCIHLVEGVGHELQRPILLIPHVGSPSPAGDDFSFVQSVCSALRDKGRIQARVVPRGLSAGELKWLISRCAIFAGARTHSTIAAMSSHVPTLCIGYSVKADGIAQDVFGHRDFRLHVTELNADNFAAKLKYMLQNQAGIRDQLADRIPALCSRARTAGALLRRILFNQSFSQPKNAAFLCADRDLSAGFRSPERL